MLEDAGGEGGRGPTSRELYCTRSTRALAKGRVSGGIDSFKKKKRDSIKKKLSRSAVSKIYDVSYDVVIRTGGERATRGGVG